ncbi:MAG: amidohydrolase family protein [Verrucomicrobiota bacterium]
MPAPDIIDCHTHCYPPEVAADPRAWAEQWTEPHWADLVAPPDQPGIQGWATPEEMRAAMDAAGVAKAVLLGWYWENEATCRWHNRVIADWVAAAPDRFIGFAAVYPNENVVAQLENAKALGLRGVGELHPGIQRFDETRPAWQKITDWCLRHHWPVNLHATEAAGHDHPGSVPTPLNTFVRMAAASPGLRIVLAHWGGGLPFFEQNPRLKKILQNVVYDSSASPLLYEPDILRRLIDLVGPGKLLFGSDYPLRVYPRKQIQPDFARMIEAFRSRLSSEEAEAFFHANARRLLETPA